jgi:hypothetical protein
MTTDQSAFSSSSQEAAPQATPAQEPSQQSAFTDQLSMIKNENGEQKYDSVNKALDALAHSQAYIPQLKSEVETKDAEIAKLREELSKREAVGEVVEKLTAQQAQPEPTPQVSGLNEQDVLNLVQNFSQQQAQQQTAASNEKLVSDALFGQYGDKTQEVVATKAAELGMTVEALQGLSQTSPQAALQLFSASVGSSQTKATTGSFNIAAQAPKETYNVAPPEKSLLRGASTNEQVEYLRKIKDSVYKRNNVET